MGDFARFLNARRLAGANCPGPCLREARRLPRRNAICWDATTVHRVGPLPATRRRVRCEAMPEGIEVAMVLRFGAGSEVPVRPGGVIARLFFVRNAAPTGDVR